MSGHVGHYGRSAPVPGIIEIDLDGQNRHQVLIVEKRNGILKKM